MYLESAHKPISNKIEKGLFLLSIFKMPQTVRTTPIPNMAYANNLCPADQIILFFWVNFVLSPYQKFKNFGGDKNKNTEYKISPSPTKDVKLFKIVII